MVFTDRWLSLAVALSGAVWGIFWLPMRALEQSGLDGVWASVALFGLTLVAALPLVWWRRHAIRWRGAGWLITGLLTGSAFALYATALLLTDVIHALLLFYLTPVWSTLLGRMMLGEKITRARLLALAMGIAGLLVVLEYSHGFPLPRNLGDWMALASGVGWAYGSVRVCRERYATAVQPLLGYNLGGFVLALSLLLLPSQYLGPLPPVAAWLDAAPLALAMTAVFLLPTGAVIFLGAMRLSPARIGLLLMAEALVGVLSAAALAGEPFGAREALGSLLIVGAGVVEVLAVQQPAALLAPDTSAAARGKLIE